MEHQDWETVVVKSTIDSSSVDEKIPRSSFIRSHASLVEDRVEEGDYKTKNITHSLKTQIQQGRQARGMTQKQLAKMCNFPDGVIRDYENGTAIPTQMHLNRISRAIGITLRNK